MNIWQISSHEIRKNHELYESEWTNKFIEAYGGTVVKQQEWYLCICFKF